MSRSKTTCGVPFKEALAEATGMEDDLIVAFAKGHMTGQAEKVYLGACRAAMFRPSERWYPMLWVYAFETAERFNLVRTRVGDEIWLLRDALALRDFYRMTKLSENSPEWHETRGRLTGVPADEIDPEFHEREGYGEVCDE